MLAARLGDPSANRAFAERWWHGVIRGADVLFPAGESMAAALRRLKGTSIYWPECVAWFRSALGKVQNLADERMEVAAALTRALKLQTKAGQVGFDWNDPLAVLSAPPLTLEQAPLALLREPPLTLAKEKLGCQAPESLDELELSSNDVDDEAKLCLPGEFESFLGRALHVVKWIANCEKNCD